MAEHPAIICLSQGAVARAEVIAAAVGGEIHGLDDRVADVQVGFSATLDHIRDLFLSGRTIIGICAAGILIRAIAPHLADKNSEPPVLAVAEQGEAVVPLLGGHHGANRLRNRLPKPSTVPPR